MGLVVDRVASAANREEARAGVAAKELALQVQGVGKKAMAAVAWPAKVVQTVRAEAVKAAVATAEAKVAHTATADSRASGSRSRRHSESTMRRAGAQGRVRTLTLTHP